LSTFWHNYRAIGKRPHRCAPPMQKARATPADVRRGPEPDHSSVRPESAPTMISSATPATLGGRHSSARTTDRRPCRQGRPTRRGRGRDLLAEQRAGRPRYSSRNRSLCRRGSGARGAAACSRACVDRLESFLLPGEPVTGGISSTAADAGVPAVEARRVVEQRQRRHACARHRSLRAPPPRPWCPVPGRDRATPRTRRGSRAQQY